jgi:4-aminobutyrate aminotransferase / (S)-3-amino-2-methylpropionate transaminase / 5-aminovalerate transaminase
VPLTCWCDEALGTAGEAEPRLVCAPPGPRARALLDRAKRSAAPMGSRPPPADPHLGQVIYAAARGSNVLDVDGNRFVDLAAGFGAMLLGHSHPAIVGALSDQAERLLQALGDVHPSSVKLELLERLARLHPSGEARVVLGQSGADAVTTALKTALLFTGRPGVVAFHGAYHGLSYGPLAACGLRSSYRTPFVAQLNPAVVFLNYPMTAGDASSTLADAERLLGRGDVGAVLIEPVLGRGGCVVPPSGFLGALASVAHHHGALLVADEIWTGLGRTGQWLLSVADGVEPDLVCLGKGLGGGVPVSACVGKAEIMQAWSQEAEVVDTSTFAGAPLACAAALAALEVLENDHLVERAATVGERFSRELAAGLSGCPVQDVRGAGLMIGIDFGRGGAARDVARRLLERGYLVSTGGGPRDVLVLTPALNVPEALLAGFIPELRAVLEA